MSEWPQDNPADRRLWRRLCRSDCPPGEVGGECPDASALAAYVDGRAGGDEQARVEAHLAVCGECLQAVREARDLLAQPAMALPRELLAKAKAMVPGEAGRRKVGAWLGLLAGQGKWKTILRWSAAAAAAVLVGFAGYFAGSATYRDHKAAEAKIVSEVSFDLAGAPEEDPLLQDDFDLLAPGKGGSQ